jgi:hypothetical protein
MSLCPPNFIQANEEIRRLVVCDRKNGTASTVLTVLTVLNVLDLSGNSG